MLSHIPNRPIWVKNGLLDVRYKWISHWWLKSSGMWCCATGWEVPMFQTITSLSGSSSLVFGCLTLEDKSTTIIWNVVNYTPNNMVSHPRRLQPLATPLWEPLISPSPCHKDLPFDNLFSPATSTRWCALFYTFLHSCYSTSLVSWRFPQFMFFTLRNRPLLHHTKQQI
jgi:hypothetical protein